MTEEPLKIIAHNPFPPFRSDEIRRKKVGEIAGIEIWSDPNVPEDELRVICGNKVVQKIKLSY